MGTYANDATQRWAERRSHAPYTRLLPLFRPAPLLARRERRKGRRGSERGQHRGRFDGGLHPHLPRRRKRCVRPDAHGWFLPVSVTSRDESTRKVGGQSCYPDPRCPTSTRFPKASHV